MIYNFIILGILLFICILKRSKTHNHLIDHNSNSKNSKKNLADEEI
jgi:hypothetical protein